MRIITAIAAISLPIFSSQALEGAARAQIKDKTLVVWTAPADLRQRGGSSLTIDDMRGHFDGVVFGELSGRKWMAGSDHYRRSQEDQKDYLEETAGKKTFVQIAIVYEGREITIYRNGKKQTSYQIDEPQTFNAQSIVMFGKRHLDTSDTSYRGRIDDARIYDRALSTEQIAKLKPNKLSDIKPIAWWPFEDGKQNDQMGTFPETILGGGVRLAEGSLVLEGQHPVMIAAPAGLLTGLLVNSTRSTENDMLIRAQRQLREKLLNDPYRPVYHFVTPEGLCMPFDPNGAIFWKGRYHLFYIYQDERGHCWGHISSTDLVHWRHHPTSLYPGPGDPDRGIFSGNCFINKKGEATMLYHGVDAGNCIATSSDEMLDVWKKLPSNPIVPNTPEDDDPREPGSAPYASWDPHGWLEGDTYYAIFGGKRPAIFKAKKLDKWEYVGDVLAHAVEGVSIAEDISCPDLFKIGDKYMLLCISHRLGCRYYLGQWKNEQFYPEFHERMSWVDPDFFAPESMLDDKGRRIMWAWIWDGREDDTIEASGWSGTMSLPRVLWLGADGMLRMRPVEELKMLRYNGQRRDELTVKAETELELKGIRGNSLELEIEIAPNGAEQVGVKVCCSPDGEEQTAVFYDATDKKLKIDTRKSSLAEGRKSIEAGPFELGADESLKLQVFVDKSVVEVFANERQAVVRCIYPSRDDSVGVILFAEGGSATVRKLRAWEMMPANPY